LIEWAELIRDILPEQCVEVTITKELDKGFDFRRIQVTGIEGGLQ
jgi:tRNA threonylcarbamoyladenosine biosynthesis protein TsaE